MLVVVIFPKYKSDKGKEEQRLIVISLEEVPTCSQSLLVVVEVEMTLGHRLSPTEGLTELTLFRSRTLMPLDLQVLIGSTPDV